jgi:hypothetical protein
MVSLAIFFSLSDNTTRATHAFNVCTLTRQLCNAKSNEGGSCDQIVDLEQMNEPMPVVLPLAQQ